MGIGYHHCRGQRVGKSADDAEAVLNWLFATKRQWAVSRGVTTKYLLNDKVRDFFIALSRRIDLATTPLVTYVKLDGKPVAASVNLVSPRVFEGFVLTYDEAFSECSPGTLLQEFCVKWSHENGREFDFRPLFSAYKARWATHQTVHDTHTLFLSARGRFMECALLTAYAAHAVHGVKKVIAKRIKAIWRKKNRSAPRHAR